MTFYSEFTEAEKLNLTEKYADELDRVLFVHCSHIKGVHMFYKCPFCFDVRNKIKYNPLKKDGTMYKSLKPHYHFHGSGFDNSNRTEGRITHCSSKYHLDEIFGSHPDLEVKVIKNKLSKEQFDFIMKKRKEFLKDQEKEIVMVVDDNTIRETSEEQQALSFIKYQKKH
tara:strand:- start:896 stop:1402 length:507 start_codon:yes stop_codon:yes gene_type:complete